jgi:hypothetical protein
VCPVVSLVTLYSFPLLAHAEAGQAHSNWNCADRHRVVEIKPVFEATVVILKSPADMERD